MTQSIEDLFIYLVLFTDLFLIILFFFFLRQNKNQEPIRIIISYCCIDLIINSFSLVTPPKVTAALYSSFTFFEYSLFAAFFFLNIQSKRFRNLILASGVFFTLFLVAYYSFNKPRSIDSIPIGIETILILIYSFYFFYEQMNNLKGPFIYSQYSFWITTGIMLYLSGSFFIYILANHIDKKLLERYFYLTNAFYVLKNILFAVAIIIHVKQKKSLFFKEFQPSLN